MVHLSKGWRTPTKQGSEFSPIQKLSKGRLLFFGARFCFVFGFLLLCFSSFVLFLLLSFLLSPFCLSCFASLLFCLSASVPFSFPLLCFFRFCFSCFSASVPFYFHFFCSSVMCFCCSTSCSSASLLPFFTVSVSYPQLLRVWNAGSSENFFS